jgi:HEAT repeat protein
MSRDYLKEASGIIFGDKVFLGQLAEKNPDQVIGNLLAVIAKANEPMQAMVRKAAAHVLGQIGELRSLKQLKQSFENEAADGIKDAMIASMTAIKLAPSPQHTQSERCRIIEDVYNNRRLADST